MEYITPLGYIIKETMFGLDIYDEEEIYLCELHGKTIADFTYDEKVDVGKLENEIKVQLDAEKFLQNNF